MKTLLRRIFSGRKETVTVEPAQLQAWLYERFEEAAMESRQSISSFEKRLTARLEQLRARITSLGRARLPNPNISVREQQLLAGNRKSYCQRALLLCDEIASQDHEQLLRTHAERMDTFAKSSSRAYQVLSHFLANEARDVALTIKDVDALIEELAHDPALQRSQHIKQLVEEARSIDEQDEELVRLGEEERALLDHQAQLRTEKEQTATALDEHRRSEDYAHLLQLREKREEIDQRLRDLRDDIEQRFGTLQRALRKYERMTLEHADLCSRYATEPFSALLADTKLHVTSLLDGLSTNLDKLGLKNSERIAQILAQTDKDFLQGTRKTHNALKARQESLVTELSEHPAHVQEVKLKAALGTIDAEHATLLSRLREVKEDQNQDTLAQREVLLEKATSLLGVNATLSS